MECLGYVDSHGDTIFNTFQCGTVLRELEALKRVSDANEQQQLLLPIEELADYVYNSTHNYLWFVGD